MTTPDPYAVTSWGVANTPFDHVTPSGQRCRVRKLTMEDVLVHGLMDELDGISSALLSDTPAESEAKEEEASVLNAFRDPAKFSRLDGTMSKIIQICVEQPVIYSIPDEVFNPHTRRNEPGPRVLGRAYVDQINFTDKISLFEVVFEGFKGLDQFREEPVGGVAAVEDVKSVPATAQLPSGYPIGND